MIVEPSWSFMEALQAAWDTYSGGVQFGAPNRIKMLEQWANVVGRDRAVADLEAVLQQYPTLKEAAKAFGFSDYALRTIRKSFLQMPRTTPHAANPGTLEQLLRSLPQLGAESSVGFIARVVPRLGTLLGYSESELFYEVALPNLGRAVHVDALFAPNGPGHPHVVVEIKTRSLRDSDVEPVVQMIRDLVRRADAHAGLFLSSTRIVSFDRSGRLVSFEPARVTAADISTLEKILRRSKDIAPTVSTTSNVAPAGQRLGQLLDEVSKAKTNAEKMFSFEQLAAEAITIHPSIRCKYRNLRTRSAELDLVCEVLSGSPFEFLREHGRFFVVECKNWSVPAGAKEVRDFLGKLRKCRVQVGVYFSRKGITGQQHGTDALREIHSAFDADGTCILVLSEQELASLATLEAVMELIEDKMDAIRFDL